MTLNWNISMKYFHGTIKLLAPKFCLLKPPVAANMSMLWTMFARLTRVLQNRLEEEVISCNGDLTDMRQMLPLFVLGWELNKEGEIDFQRFYFITLDWKQNNFPPIFYFFSHFYLPHIFLNRQPISLAITLSRNMPLDKLNTCWEALVEASSAVLETILQPIHITGPQVAQVLDHVTGIISTILDPIHKLYMEH